MNLQSIRTNSEHAEYKNLVRLLDKDIRKRDGSDFEFYSQFNGSENIQEVVLVFENDKALGCGTIKKYDTQTAEVKRMFTAEDARGKGVATQILDELTTWARELGYEKLVLETGKKYPEAIALYQKYGFKQTENYGQYIGVDESVCFAFKLDSRN